MAGKQRLARAAVTMALVAGLGACGAGSDGPGNGGRDGGQGAGKAAQQSEPQPETVSGLRDTTRHVTKRTAKAERPRMVKKCRPATKRVKHTKRTGTGSSKRTRTWYTTERYGKCAKVRQGTETYKRVVRAERWCVRLDDVNGRAAQDDVWYRVPQETYSKVLEADERARVKITPKRTGC